MKEVNGHPGYSVDECGNVYSHRRKQGRGRGNGLGTRVIIDFGYCRKLKPRPGRGGYPVVYLSGGHSKQCYIHRIVADTFIPNPEKKPCVNHKDFNIQNPSVSNLEWVTYSENNKHSVKHGRMAGEKSNLGKLTIVEVKAIRALAETTVRRKDIASLFGITPDYVTRLLPYDKIFQEVKSVDDGIPPVIDTLIRQIMDTREQQTRDMLIKLGWTPPKEVTP
jgi:hypothetical protein